MPVLFTARLSVRLLKTVGAPYDVRIDGSFNPKLDFTLVQLYHLNGLNLAG